MQELFDLFYQSNGICTDTRALVKDCLFICLKGDRFDANEFAEKAVEGGAKYVVASDPARCNGTTIHHVDNTLQYLQQLALYHRRKFNIPVLGITGSNGKTTTKELVNAVLSTSKKVLCTKGNLNNHIGVPLTLLQLSPEHEIAIIEMGANRPGDIAELCEIAQPTHGIITNIGKAHLEGFGSFEGVLNTKLGLYNFVEHQQGTLFYNSDDSVLTRYLPNLSCSTYAIHNSATVVGTAHDLTPFLAFKYTTQQGIFGPIYTQLVGEYNLYNFLSAVTIGLYFGVSSADVERALSSYVPSNNRSQVQKTERNTLIVDCYNANPSSMGAALISFHQTKCNNKLALLGDMLELGEVSKEEHAAVLRYCETSHIPCITVGKEFGECRSNFRHFATTAQLIDSEVLASINDTTILIKGSRGIGLEQIIPFL